MTDQQRPEFARTPDEITAYLTANYERLRKRVSSPYRHRAEDAIHIAVERLWRKFKQGDETVWIENLDSYFKRALWNHTRREFGGGKRRKYQEGPDVSYDPDLHDIRESAHPEEWHLRREAEQREEQQIEDAKNTLSDRERTILIRVINGERQYEIAKDLGVSRQMVTKIYARAKEKLRKWGSQNDG